jgi:hypothetical protein
VLIDIGNKIHTLMEKNNKIFTIGLASQLTGDVLALPRRYRADERVALLAAIRKEESAGMVVVVWCETDSKRIYVTGTASYMKTCSHLKDTALLADNQRRGLKQLEEYLRHTLSILRAQP